MAADTCEPGCACHQNCPCVSNSSCDVHDPGWCWHHNSPQGDCPTVHVWQPFMGGSCGASVHNEDGDIDLCHAALDDLVHQVWGCKADERCYHDRGPCSCDLSAGGAE